VNSTRLETAFGKQGNQRSLGKIRKMLIDQLPARLVAQNIFTIGDFKIDYQIASIANSFAHCGNKLPRFRHVLQYMAADDQVCRFFSVFGSVIADAAVITAVADYAKKVAPSAADFNNTFTVQPVCPYQSIRQFLGVLLESAGKHLRVFVLLVMRELCELIVVSAVENVRAIVAKAQNEWCFVG
jgi:hypothetical protein